MPSPNVFEDIVSQMTGDPDKCWTGLGSVDKTTGYARIGIANKKWFVHRLSYTHFYGTIPPESNIDHTCHNEDLKCPGGKTCRHRKCFNPFHLEAVSPTENKRRGKSLPAQNARKTKCNRGHEFTTTKRGRRCEICYTALRVASGHISPLGRKVDRTHCPQNHEYTTENTYLSKTGNRHCRACGKNRARARRISNVV